MNNPFLAPTLSLLLYFILCLSYLGWGTAVTHSLKAKPKAAQSDFSLVWLGWATTLLIFQILHLFFPLTAYVVIPVLLVGVILAGGKVVDLIHSIRWKRSTVGIHAGVFLAGSAVAAWVALRSMLPPENYDSGLYHLSAIRWINTFPIVPGLGNLQGRLAFNQSFFTYVAALNFFPFFNNGRSIANSFLWLLTLATLIRYLLPYIKQPASIAQTHPFKYIPALFAIPTLGYLAITSKGLASPSPDLTSTLLQITMFVILSACIADWLNGEKDHDYPALAVTLLAATSVTIKLSNAIFAAAMFAFVLIYFWKSSRRIIYHYARVLIPAGIIVAVWCLRGFVLSGAPLFPSTFGYLAVDWAVPREKVIVEANLVYSWARLPYTDWREVLGNWNWLGAWFTDILRYRADVVYPVLLAVAFFAFTLFLLGIKKGQRPRFLEWVIVLPVLFGLIYWFFSAPNMRFANALFFLLEVCMLLLCFTSIYKTVRRRIFLTFLFVTFIGANLLYANTAFKQRETFTKISLSGYQPVTEVVVVAKETQSGLLVFKPESGEQCWDAPLPCTPYFNPQLTLRKEGDLASGFTVIELVGDTRQ